MDYHQTIGLYRELLADPLLPKISEGVKIAVLGDFWLDEWRQLEPAEISRETGARAMNIRETIYTPGVAGTVTSCLRALEVSTFAIGIIGTDYPGQILLEGLKLRGVDCRWLLTNPHRITPFYAKRCTDTEPQLTLDVRDYNERLMDWEEGGLILFLKSALEVVNGIIVIDHQSRREVSGFGIITPSIRELVSVQAREKNLILLADSRYRIQEFGGFRFISPNAYEATTAIGHNFSPVREIPEEIAIDSGIKLCQKLNCEAAIITRGVSGASICTQSGSCHIPTVAVEDPNDPTGAGDTFDAALTVALCAGWDIRRATLFANVAARVIVKKLGTTGTATMGEIKKELKQITSQEKS